jgi:hypothetical protein
MGETQSNPALVAAENYRKNVVTYKQGRSRQFLSSMPIHNWGRKFSMWPAVRIVAAGSLPCEWGWNGRGCRYQPGYVGNCSLAPPPESARIDWREVRAGAPAAG